MISQSVLPPTPPLAEMTQHLFTHFINDVLGRHERLSARDNMRCSFTEARKMEHHAGVSRRVWSDGYTEMPPKAGRSCLMFEGLGRVS